MEQVILELHASDKVVGDLITYMVTGPGKSKVVVVDKNNEHFKNADAGEVWQMQLVDKGNWMLASLIQPINLSFERVMLEKGGAALQVFHQHPDEALELLVTLPFPDSGEWNQFVKGSIQVKLKSVGLSSLEAAILSEFRMDLEWFNSVLAEAKDVVGDAIELLKLSQGDATTTETPLAELEILDIVWGHVKLDNLSTAEDIAAELVAQGYVYRKGKFFKQEPNEIPSVTA